MRAIDARRSPMEMLAEDFTRRLRAGDNPELDEYLERYPAYADEIRNLFPLIAILEDAKPREEAEATSDPSDETQPSLMLFGDYHILREIGRGGMAIVYEAKQQSLERRVALKVLPQNYLPTSKHIVRFKREAQSVARLHHTNIVPVFGVGEQDGNHYFVMQYINGRNLDAVITALHDLCETGVRRPSGARQSPDRQLSPSDFAEMLVSSKLDTWAHRAGMPRPTTSTSGQGPRRNGHTVADSGELSERFSEFFIHEGGVRAESYYWRNIASIGVCIAEALQHAHDQSVLHRDIKPANLMIDHEGTPWITDFGLAKIAGDETLTASQDTVGTLRYMAPEQLRGKFDARSEVYSLGLTLYELAALRPAFTEPDRSLLIQQIIEKIPPLPRSINPGIPRKLETIILKAIEKEPRNRYQSSNALREDLQRFLSGDPLRARRSTPVAAFVSWCNRNAAVVRLASALLILLLLIPAAASIDFVRSSKTRLEQEEQLEQAQRERAQALEDKRIAEEAAAEALRRADVLERQLEELQSDSSER